MATEQTHPVPPYEPPSIIDFGSISAHTFGSPPGVCRFPAGERVPTDVFAKHCGVDYTEGGFS